LALSSQIISKGFNGRHGRAYLVAPTPSAAAGDSSGLHTAKQRNDALPNLPNTYTHKPVPRQLVTGAHTVGDISCSQCGSVLGWKYISAEEESQRYKVGKFILEAKKVCRNSTWESEDGIEEAEMLRQSGMAGRKKRRSFVMPPDAMPEVVEFDSQDEEECEELFMGVWTPGVARKRRQSRVMQGGKSIAQAKHAPDTGVEDQSSKHRGAKKRGKAMDSAHHSTVSNSSQSRPPKRNRASSAGDYRRQVKATRADTGTASFATATGVASSSSAVHGATNLSLATSPMSHSRQTPEQSEDTARHLIASNQSLKRSALTSPITLRTHGPAISPHTILTLAKGSANTMSESRREAARGMAQDGSERVQKRESGERAFAETVADALLSDSETEERRAYIERRH
ncbi:hypothetical protein LTR95_015227, partial [Oleoguttula sp. CCFEE 5521]